MIMLCVGGPNHGEEVAIEGAALVVAGRDARFGYKTGRYTTAPVHNEPEVASPLVAGLWCGWDK